MAVVAALAVALVHLALIGFVVLAPFASDRHAVVAHLLLVPFLWIHWLLNDDTCFLTLVECRLRGLEQSQSFMHSLVSPVYKIRDDDLATLSWIASVALWLVSLARVVGNFSM